MDYLFLLAPELVLLVGACSVLLAGLSHRPGGREAVSWLAVATVVVAVAVFWQVGLTQEHLLRPGIRISPLTAYVRMAVLLVGLVVVLVNLHVPDPPERGEYTAMILLSMAGVMLTASADDFITLLLSLELVSVPTYVLVTVSSREVRAQEAGLKYFFLGALSAAFLLYGLTFLYGATGTTRLSAVAGGLPVHSGYAVAGLLLAIGGLAYKIAAVPLHVYAPDVYQGAAPPMAGLLGFFPKMAGFVAVVRLLALVLPEGPTPSEWVVRDVIFWTLWIVAATTMTFGNCVALLQTDVRRILGYSSIAHSGYMLIAVLAGPGALGGPFRDGWSAVLFYLVAYGLTNLGAFAVLGYLNVGGRPASGLHDICGLARIQPAAALVLAVCLFSLMGMPPTAGFFAKIYVFLSGLSLGPEHPHRTAMVALVVVGVLNSAIGAVYYLRLIGACYLREPREFARARPDRSLRTGLALCALAAVLLGLWPREVVRWAGFATRDLQPLVFIERPPLENVSRPALRP